MAKTKPSILANDLSRFLDHQKIDRGAAAKTLEAYERDLNQWIRSPLTPQDTVRISENDLKAYIQTLSEAGQKSSSIARKLSAIRQFFKFCALEGIRTDLPIENLITPKIEKKIPKFLALEEVLELLRAADAGYPYPSETRASLQARDRAMVYLLYASGLRVSELSSLNLEQLDLAECYVRVRGKGSKERIAPFAPEAGEHLREYIETHRPKLAAKFSGPSAPSAVFLNHRGSELTRQTAWIILKQLAQIAELKSNLTPHLLRHSFATHMLQNGVSLRSLQMLLGHSDLSTTQIYTHVTPDHLKAAHQRFHPRGSSRGK